MILAGGAAELVQQEADARAARLNAQFFRTGSPVPRGWRPRPERLSAAHRGKRSVARGRLVIYYPHAIDFYHHILYSKYLLAEFQSLQLSSHGVELGGSRGELSY